MALKPNRNVDEYIAQFSGKTQALLQEMRNLIKKSAPLAEEVISYNMPAYKSGGILCYFAGYENHIGLYAMPGAIQKFSKELSAFKTSKGTIQFPLDRPLPRRLIAAIIKFRVAENLVRTKAKATKKKAS